VIDLNNFPAILSGFLFGSKLAVNQDKEGRPMKATTLLHNLGQSIWLDNLTRDLLTGGALNRYIDELAMTGLTSNPTILVSPLCGSVEEQDQGTNRTNRNLCAANGERVRQDCELIA
jgi:hypothetical protein